MSNPKYNSLSEWRKSEPKAFIAAKRNNLLDKICVEFGWELRKKLKPKGFWNLEKCKKEALKYNSRKEWQRKSSSSYTIAYNNRWLNKCTKHMIITKKPANYWTLEECKKEALKYNSNADWRKKSSNSYSAAQRYNFIDKCSKHMINIKAPNGFWTLEKCKKEALKYNTPQNWKEHNKGSYSAAQRLKILDVCTKHMIKKTVWSKELCKKDALKYKVKSEWASKSSSAYNAARKNNWLFECCDHMNKKS